MSYGSYESSIDSGSPIELYEFTQGGNRWYFTSHANPIEKDNNTYLPSPMTRGKIKLTSDVMKDSLKLSFPRGDAFAGQFLGFSPEKPTTVTILRGHITDPSEDFVVYWKGRIIGASAGGNKIDVDCESIYTSIKRPGLRARFEYNCRHVLYGGGCNLNREAFKVSSVIGGLSGGLWVTLEPTGKPDGYFTGGMLVSSQGATRFISAHVGDQLTISRPDPELEVGEPIDLYPGCDHLKTTCKNKFNNLDNFGGFPYIPVRNPFDGSSIV